MFEPISAAQFKMHCLRLMDEVQKYRGEIIVTKHGKPVAKLVPVTEKQRERPLFGYMKGSVIIKGDIVGPTGEKWEADE
jgi:prevent-host-death family protein